MDKSFLMSGDRKGILPNRIGQGGCVLFVRHYL